MDHPYNLADVLQAADEMTRREFLKRAAVSGLAPTMLGALLAACGGGAPATATTGMAATATTAESLPTIAVGQPRTGAASPVASPTAGPAASATHPATGTPGASPATRSMAGAKRGGTMVVVGHQDMASLSPDDAGPTVHYVLVANIHSAMLRIDENYTVVPDLAENYTITPDGMKYTFTLRKGVKWHDGQPFSSADVKYTIDYYGDPKNAAVLQPLFKSVASVDTPNDQTVVITMKEANAAFLIQAATAMIVPKHYHGQIGEKEYKKKPVGTGPFKLKEWRPNEFTLLEAFDGYYGGRPFLDGFRENKVPEPAVRAVALETGEADSSVWPIAPEDTLRLMNSPNFATFRSPGTAVNHYPLNHLRPQLQDKRVRQAMLFAINRDSLVKDLLKELAVKATANLSPAVQAYYTPDVKQYPYDPEQAKKLLDEAGYKSGPNGIRVNGAGQQLSFTCNVIVGDSLRHSEAELTQRDLKEVGIEVKLQEVEVSAITTKSRSGDYDMALFNWTYGGVEPDATVTLHTGSLNNWSHWSNKRVDELLEQGLRETDPQKRKPIYAEIQKLVAEEVPFLYIMFWETILLFNKRIKGLPGKALNPYALYTVNTEKLWIG